MLELKEIFGIELNQEISQQESKKKERNVRKNKKNKNKKKIPKIIISNIVKYIQYEHFQAVITKKFLKLHYLERNGNIKEHHIEEAIQYCKNNDDIREIDFEVYEIKNKKKGKKYQDEYSFPIIKEMICGIKDSFYSSDLCKKWGKEYDNELIKVAVTVLKKEGVLIYNPEYVTYRVKRKV